LVSSSIKWEKDFWHPLPLKIILRLERDHRYVCFDDYIALHNYVLVVIKASIILRSGHDNMVASVLFISAT
jgi:hypothetical protein